MADFIPLYSSRISQRRILHGKCYRMDEKGTLRPEQRAAIRVLLTGTVEEAAEAAGRTRTTIYRWLKEPTFKATLLEAEGEALAALSRALVHLGEKAANALEAVFDNPRETGSVKVRAASVTLAQILKLRELYLLERRVAEMEKKLGGTDDEAA